MEEDIDIYADLPSITADKNDRSCNCEDIKRELNSLRSALENIQKIKENLENNLFSLLKTAKAEIMRKDNMIDDLRKRLDDVAFRRNNKGESQIFSAHKQSHRIPAAAETYESVSYAHSYESENNKLNQTELRCDESKRIKSEKSVDQVFTVFGERLHKKMIKDEVEEKKVAKVASLKLNPEISARETSKENILESDKENGSQLNVNNDHESNVAMKNSSSEIPYRNNSERRRMSEESNMRETKRIKIENDKNASGKSDYNFIAQYDLKESFAQNEMKNNPVKLEGRLDAVLPFKKEQDSFNARYRAISEHKDVRQDQYCTNGRRRRRSNSRDCDDRKRKSVDRYWTTSASERSNSDYKESNYRYSRGRSYSSSRSNHESLSSHHLRIRSSNTYRSRKYDDCKNDRRYRSERSRRDYDSRGDGDTKRCSRERSNLRDASKYVLSNIEDGESGNSYKNSKYEKHRIKEAEESVSNNKRSHNSAAAETDLQTSSSRTVVNTIVNYSDEKDEAKSKLDIKSANSMESASVNDLNNLEEGEILDSPKKTNNFEDLSSENKIKEEKCTKMSPIKDKNEQLNSENNDKVSNEKTLNYNNDVNVCGLDHLPYHQNLADSTVEIVETIEQIHDDNINDIIETANNAKEKNDINSFVKSDSQITKTNDLGIRDAIDISEDNNFVTDNVACKIEQSSAESTTKVEAVFNCDIESRDEISTKKGDIFLERSDRCNTGASHLCLSDHNYNQSPSANENDFDAVEKLPVTPGGRKTVSATVKTTEVQLEEESVNAQSIDVKRTASSLVKNKKDQDKGIVISRRRKAVTLSDSNASMTVLMNTDMQISPISCNDNDSVLKPRACKTPRASINNR